MSCENKPPNMQIWSRGFCSFCKFIERSSGRRHIIYDEQGCILREQAYCRRKENECSIQIFQPLWSRKFHLRGRSLYFFEARNSRYLKLSCYWLYPFWKYLRYRCEGTKEIKSWSFCIARVRSGLSCVNKAHLSAKNPAISLLWWNLSLRMSFLRSVL